MKAVIALGSNLGDRRAHLDAGLTALRSLGVVVPSPLVMETPDESGRGPAYLNTVAILVTGETDPRRLLEALLRLELAAGRDRSAGKNAPRTLDLDLITTDGQPGSWAWTTPEDLRAVGPELSLELPHPRAFSRPFVLEPWRALSDPGACGGVIPGN
jgi:2-amino-4-hydroxy-6-hydroxymethyldihydropteridine diphosphokinase